MNTSTTHAEAFRLMAAGYSVIPVGRDKKPLLRSWKEWQDKRPQEAEIEAWWGRWPDANVGIITGKISSITVIDVDTHAGGKAEGFPETYTVKTGNGGLQLYYKYEPKVGTGANVYADRPHVDMRNDGGFVVAPPSIIDAKVEGANGKYEVVKDMDIQPFPAMFVPLGEGRRKLKDTVSVSQGGRNDSMASFIGRLLYSTPENDWKTGAWPVVVDVNKTYNPPLSSRELAATFNSIADKERTRRQKPQLSPVQFSSDERGEILLRKGKNGAVYKDAANALLALRQHPKYEGKIRLNLFQNDIEFGNRGWQESDLIEAMLILQQDMGLAGIAKAAVADAVSEYARQNSYDEVCDWLGSLVWDKKERLATWLIVVAGLEDTPYHRGVGAQWLLGAVRRAMEPGCIFDYVLTLVGDQNIGKTSLFRILGGKWYKDFSGSVDNKDFYMALRGALIVDIDEGVAMYKAESIKMKSIISSCIDEYRAPYARTTERFPRRFVFSMTTNDVTPLRDTTGNRRYWPVRLSCEKIDFEWLENNRDQIFAEALDAYRSNRELPEVPQDVSLQIQEDMLDIDPWEDAVVEYLNTKHPLHNEFSARSEEFSTTMVEIYHGAIADNRDDDKENIERVSPQVSRRLSAILRRVGLEKRRARIDKYNRSYQYKFRPDLIKSQNEDMDNATKNLDF